MENGNIHIDLIRAKRLVIGFKNLFNIMSNFYDPVLIIGDTYKSKNDIISFKNKLKNEKWVQLSATDNPPENIRDEIGNMDWDDSKKAILIQDIPNKKQIKEFLIEITNYAQSQSLAKIILWDSKNFIKEDTIDNKFWKSFIESFKKINGSKIINNGDKFTQKESIGYTSFIKKLFLKHNKEIDNSNCKLITEIVGFDRGLLSSEIDKLCINCPSPITSDFILENAFHTSKEIVIYELSNALDSGKYEESINVMQDFLNNGVNENVMADIIVKKARWQLIASYYWSKGMSWSSIISKISSLGKFPAQEHHNGKNVVVKDMLEYMVKKQGIPKCCFNEIKEEVKTDEEGEGKESKKKKVRSETMYETWKIEKIVDFIQYKVVNGRSQDDPKVRSAVLKRAINVYLFVLDKLAEIRYGENPEQDLTEIIRAMTNTKIGVGV